MGTKIFASAHGGYRGGRHSIAIIGLACRFPDADDPPGLLDLVLTGRRAFRRVPVWRAGPGAGPGAVPMARSLVYGPEDDIANGAPNRTLKCRRMAVLEGWQFDPAAFAIAGSEYRLAGPGHWLALETAGRALAAAGFPAGSGLPAARTGVFLGAAAGGQLAAGLAARLGCQGGYRTIEGGGASSLLAVASACLALSAGELDVALAGGVEFGTDPRLLANLARAGQLADGEMRVYDREPTGFLPGEGCGIVVLTRTADARAAGLPVYAEILGWGTAAAAGPAMEQAYLMAGVDPAEPRLVEGAGTGLADADEAELHALGALRAGARDSAVLGSIAANIGYAGAAAGSAGLIKTVLALTTGVLPPATGTGTPHALITSREAGLRLPAEPAAWPDPVRLAAVNALDRDLLDVHLVLRSVQGGAAAARRARPAGPEPGAGHCVVTAPVSGASGRRPLAYLFQAPDRPALAAILAQIANIAPWLSDSELTDLACQLSREAAGRAPENQRQSGAAPASLPASIPATQLPGHPASGPEPSRAPDLAAGQGAARAAIVAADQERLAELASEALSLLPALGDGLLAVRPGIFAADQADGRITLLISGQPEIPGQPGDGAGPPRSGAEPILRWLDRLGVDASAVVGYGMGEPACLAWAGCVSADQASALSEALAEVLAAPLEARPELLARRLATLAPQFRPPRRRLISAGSGTELAAAAEIAGVLRAGLTPASPAQATARLDRAVAAGAVGASLLLETGPGTALAEAAARACQVPAVSLRGGLADERAVADVTAALFAVGALGDPAVLYAGLPARPIDIWRDRVFTHGASVTRIRRFVRDPARPAGQAGHRAEARTPQFVKVPARSGEQAGNGAGTSQPRPTGPIPDQARPVARSGPERLAPALRGPGPAPEDPGAGPLARCYAELLRRPEAPIPAGNDRPWRIFTGGSEPFRSMVDGFFRHQPEADRTLAVIGPAVDLRTVTAALAAARDAADTGRLVVISSGTALRGLWACLRAEHPSLGLTMLRAPLSLAGLGAAGRVAVVRPGTHLEFVIGTDGAITEPALLPFPADGGSDFPLGPDDVVLLNRGAGGTGLAVAQVLACSGAAVALIGQEHGEHDEAVIGGLEELRAAGARISYEIVDTADPDAIAAAVRRIRGRLGQVTAIGHAIGVTTRAPVTELSAGQVLEAAASQLAGVDRLAHAVRAAGGRLRLIATFGSVASRYGLAEEGLLALAGEALAGRARELAAAIPGCRALHMDWPGWTGAGLGERPDLAGHLERAGFAPMSVADGSRLLLKALTTSGLPERLVIHGRAGKTAPGSAAPQPVQAPVPQPVQAPVPQPVQATVPSPRQATGQDPAGAGQPGGPWPLPLLAGYLRQAGTAAGLGPGLEVRIGAARAGAGTASSSGGALGRGRWSSAASSGLGLAGLGLAVRASGPAACAWLTTRPDQASPVARPGLASHPSSGTWRYLLGGLLGGIAEPQPAAAARIGSVLACLADSSAPPDLAACTLRDAGDGWLILSDGSTTIGSVVLRVAGITQPVAIAVSTAHLVVARPTRPAIRYTSG